MRQSWMLVVLALCAGGCETVRHVGEVFSGNTALRAAKRMEDPYFPDERREGINYLVDHGYGQRPPYTKRYQQIALGDADYTVRAAAIGALKRAGDNSATGVFISALGDRSELVRLAAANALASLPDRRATEPLTKMLADPNENKDVRIACADALKHYPDAGSTKALMASLNGREFGIAWQARKSLIFISGGKDLRYNADAWAAALGTSTKPVG